MSAAAEIIGDKEAAELFGLSRVALRQHCMASYACPRGKVVGLWRERVAARAAAIRAAKVQRRAVRAAAEEAKKGAK